MYGGHMYGVGVCVGMRLGGRVGKFVYIYI